MLGVATVDPAALGQLIQTYVGSSDAPRWAPTYVYLQGQAVLVVTVESPQAGDRIFSLRREFKFEGKTFRDGSVFVRRTGQTVPADAADLDALQARLLATKQTKGEVSLSIVGDTPLSWIDGATVNDAIRTWVSDQRDQLIKEAHAVDTQRHRRAAAPGAGASTTVLPAFTAIAAQLLALQTAGLLGKPDPRTLSEFTSEVDDWSAHTLKDAATWVMAKYLRAGHAVIRVQLHNPTGRFLPDVEVKITFEGGVTILDERPKQPAFRPLPRRFGENEPLISPMDPRSLVLSSPMGHHFPTSVSRRQKWVKITDGITIFHVDDLRQGDTQTSDPVYVVLKSRPGDGVVRATWTATIRDQEGVLFGTLEIPVAEVPTHLEMPTHLDADDDG